MTLPSWKYYSGDLGRSPKEEAVKENLRVGQSEPLRLGTEFSIDSTSMFCKAFELVLQMRGRSGTEQAGACPRPKRARQESRPGIFLPAWRQWGISDKQSLSEIRQLTFKLPNYMAKCVFPSEDSIMT